MPTVDVTFYDGEPDDNGFSTSGTFVYTGPATAEGTATITDTGSGSSGLTLDDEGDDAVADVTIGGQTSLNSEIDAEKAWLIRDDVTGETFNVVEFQVEDGSASGEYTLSERPLVPGRSYTVLDYSDEPDASAGDPVFTYSEFVCYATGTLVLTDTGEVPVEKLAVGDRLITLDNGAQTVRWIGSRRLTFREGPNAQKPIEIKRGALSANTPERRLMVSPQHRMLFGGPVVEAMFGEREVLALAKGLVGLDHVRAMNGKREVTYYSLLCDRHEIIRANGAWSESFYPGRTALGMIGAANRRAVEKLFPCVKADPVSGYGPKARHVLTRAETEDLVGALHAAGATRRTEPGERSNQTADPELCNGCHAPEATAMPPQRLRLVK
ncbi:MAG: Hint domain-containing protein [Pseudomonadota bacterium]